MKVEFTVDQRSLEQVRKAIGEFGGKARFATSVGLNRTADEIQQAIRRHLPQAFTLRRRDFIEKTIYRKPGEDFASKAQLQAGVRVREDRDVLAKFEEGGEKRPRSGKALAVPIDVKRNKRDIVPRSRSVRALLASGKAFIKNGRVWEVVGRGRRRLLRLAYVFKPATKVPASLEFTKTAYFVAERRLSPNLLGAIDKEIRDGGLTSTSGPSA